jgi:histidinol-phosphatase (PHP family)
LTTNLHTHTSHSDGSSRPDAYISEAIRQGFDVLGFSDHAPVPFRNSFAIPNAGPALKKYCEEILSLKNQYHTPFLQPGPKITIHLGLELDYIPGMTLPADEYRKEYPFDYIIGSVHLVRNDDSDHLWFIDGPYSFTYDAGLCNFFRGDIRKAVATYYGQIRDMVLAEKPEIVGHLDKIKMHNRGRFFSEEDPWYLREVDETLEVIRDAGCVVEVNTRGIYKKRSDSLYPGPVILKKILGMKIPVILTSDAHKPHELSGHFHEAKELLKSLGFSFQQVLTGNGWVQDPL